MVLARSVPSRSGRSPPCCDRRNALRDELELELTRRRCLAASCVLVTRGLMAVLHSGLGACTEPLALVPVE